MQKYKEQLTSMSEHILPLLVLLILLFYTYVRFFEHPYPGFRPDSEGRIIELYDNHQSLNLYDRLVEINDVPWKDFKENLRRPLYGHAQPGQAITLKIERVGQPNEIISWVFPGPTKDELFQLVSNQSWLAYAFWFFGALTSFLMHPKDERWKLMIAFNYLTAIWIIVGGSVSFNHLRESAILLRMVVWLCVPVYLHLNWVFLKPLSKLPAPFVCGIYGFAGALAIAEWFQITHPELYYLGFALAVGGSAVLIVLHMILQREVRRDLSLLIVTALLALFLPVIFGLMKTFGVTALAQYGGAAIFSLPLLPLGYFYASYRRQLGNLELRVNRFVSAYLFLILLGVASFPSILLVNLWPDAKGFVEAATIFLMVVVSIFGFPYFQVLVERHMLGIRLPLARLQQTYAARITTSMSLDDLQHLMMDEILPSLLVRQFVSLEFDQHSTLKPFFVVGVTEGQYPHEADIAELRAASGKSHPFAQLTDAQPSSWVRLVLPLKIGEKLIGLWLFGRRDPDDLYSQLEIPLLQSLADQTAIAQTNLVHMERLKAFYMADIDRHELERQSLAHELHDSVLHELATLMTNPDASLPPSFEDDYDKLVQKIREIVGNLRPPMLNYGLELALNDLADNLSERASGARSVTAEIQANGSCYPQNIEQHIYRIVQEACENAMRHAQAKNIHIAGRLDLKEIVLTVTDDGIGFQVVEDLNLDNLLANKHFGLAGMRERAELIGAKLSIHSVPNAGTSIQVAWL